MTSALVPITHGTEEMEAVIIVDVLRRAEWRVVCAGVGAMQVKAARGVVLVADVAWEDVDPSSFDVLAIPGGGDGTDTLAAQPDILATVRSFVDAGKIVGAICAGPLVLQAAGVLEGRRATCHPCLTS